MLRQFVCKPLSPNTMADHKRAFVEKSHAN